MDILLHTPARHTFEIGQNDFLLDGKLFVIRCGEIHFPRVPREYWRHRLQMCRALGLNTVCVYLFWNFHEWEEGRFDWSGQKDAAEFCRLAQEEGLWVLLRPGPYSCAEWEMGGLPWWLVKHDDIKLRSRDLKFLEPAVRFMNEVGRVLGPQQITRGGPLLMVQVENEYGSFGHDAEYMGVLRQALIDGGFDVPLFACNPPGAIASGHRNDLFQVVNFGAGGAKEAFATLRNFQKAGPLMNGEYYPAWFDMWGRKHRTGPVEPIIADLGYMLTHQHSFSIYMAHGGTSFGLWAGADRPFSPDTSSYDYDAPISEAGWATPKFKAMRELFGEHLLPGEKLADPPSAPPVLTTPVFELKETAALFDNLPTPVVTEIPRTMEFHGQSRGCTLYRTTLPAGPGGALKAAAVHDFGWIFLDGKHVGVMDRRSRRFSVELPERNGPARLDILVEAMGRVNFGQEVFDRKGLHAPVEFAGEELKGWQVFTLPLDDSQLAMLAFQQTPATGPAFWRGEFELEKPGDTFLDLRSWGKGVAWVNGHCLGRFWNIGPTQTMYCPGPWLRSGRNEVLVFDLLGPRQPSLQGFNKPILDELHPELDFARKQRAAGACRLDNLAPVASGSFCAEIRWQEARFQKPTKGRYLCLEALNSIDGYPVAALAELAASNERGERLSKASWKVFWVSSEETNFLPGDADNLLDGQPATFWHSDAAGNPPPDYPHRIIIDFGQTEWVGAVQYLPRAGSSSERGRIKDYRIYCNEEPFGLLPPGGTRSS